MGRWRTDVLALACIAGGAVVGAGVTAGLTAWGSGPAGDVEVACGAVASSQLIVRVREGDSSPRNVRIVRAGSCAPSVTVDVADVRERMDRARARAEVARVESEEVRLRMEEVRERMEAVRHQVREVQIPAQEARITIERLRALDEVRIEALERQLEALGDQLEADLSGGELEAALETLRTTLREEIERAGSGGND